MKLFDALRNMRQLQAMAMANMAANVVLSIVVAYLVVQLSGVRERIVLVPPNMDAKAEIAWTSANKEYIKSFGLFMATLVGNIQPKSSSSVLESVSAFMDPQIYNSFRGQMLAVIEDPVFKASGSVISFLPSTIQYETETGRVFVTGTIITSTSGSQKYSKAVTYEIGTDIRQGRPWVTHFTSYEGSVPRTVTWWVQQNARDGKPIPDVALPERWKKNKSSKGPEQEESDFSVMKLEAAAAAAVHPAPVVEVEPDQVAPVQGAAQAEVKE